MIFLDAANDIVRSGFNFLIDVIRIGIEALKKIPTGFGVSVYYFLIACIITGVVVSGIVNVVKASSLVPTSERGRKGKEEALKRFDDKTDYYGM